jgi:hypothetical protein
MVFFSACQDSSECCHDLVIDHQLEGSWQLYEVGYSPGDRYITEQVPSIPAQTITFFSDGRLSSNFSGISDYSLYEVTTDSITNSPVLSLYKTVWDAKIKDPGTRHSYSISYDGENLKLSYRFCIEGCHLGFKKTRHQD